jgi:hypothetical protein
MRLMFGCFEYTSSDIKDLWFSTIRAENPYIATPLFFAMFPKFMLLLRIIIIIAAAAVSYSSSLLGHNGVLSRQGLSESNQRRQAF